MNYIIKNHHNVAAISNVVKADTHRHWMLQLFLCCYGNLDIMVDDENIVCKCIIVDSNTWHKFSMRDAIHLTLLIDPASDMAKKIRMAYFQDKPYFVLDDVRSIKLQSILDKTWRQPETNSIRELLNSVYDCFTVCQNTIQYDERIEKLLHTMDSGEYSTINQGIQYWAEELALSPSRLAHLFKDQTGIPLKSYMLLQQLWRAYDLVFSGETITFAAIQAGFDSSSHMAYTNKKMTGMSARGIIKDSVFLKV